MRWKTIKHSITMLIALAVMLSATATVFADGTETLGPVETAAGTDVIAAGTGLALSETGTINLIVPPGSAINQVLLYWEGQMATNVVGDSSIIINNNLVEGAQIGGQTHFFSSAYSSAFRADITGLNLISPGANSLSVGGLEGFTRVAN